MHHWCINWPSHTIRPPFELSLLSPGFNFTIHRAAVSHLFTNILWAHNPNLPNKIYIQISSTKYMSKSPQQNINRTPRLSRRAICKILTRLDHHNQKWSKYRLLSRFQFQAHKPFVQCSPDAFKYTLSCYDSLIASASKTRSYGFQLSPLCHVSIGGGGTDSGIRLSTMQSTVFIMVTAWHARTFWFNFTVLRDKFLRNRCFVLCRILFFYVNLSLCQEQSIKQWLSRFHPASYVANIFHKFIILSWCTVVLYVWRHIVVI